MATTNTITPPAPYVLDPKDAVANYVNTGLIGANNPAPSGTMGGLLSATTLPTAAPYSLSSAPSSSLPSALPGTVTNADSSTFNALGEAPKQEAFGYTPVGRSLDAAKETVAGQFNTLTQQDNPLMQMARTGANQQMNARGLLNSSLALTAADAAAYQAALPIANADATAYQQASRENQAYTSESAKAASAAKNEAAKNDLAVWTDLAKSNLDSAMKTQLAGIEADYKTTMQGSATAAEMYKQAMKNITDIAASNTMNIEAKRKATENQLFILKSGMDIAGTMSNLDLRALLDFSEAPALEAPPPPAEVPGLIGQGGLYDGGKYSWDAPGVGWTLVRSPTGDTPGLWIPPPDSGPSNYAYENTSMGA